MNYKESIQILEEVKKADKVLVNCHRGPDSDSVGSALALSRVIGGMGKKVTVICPSDIPEDLRFLEGADKIQRVDYASFNFKDYDLFLAIDSSNYSMVSGSKELEVPKDVEVIVLDHHVSNLGFGKINLIDAKVTSTGELLFRVFEDWKVDLNLQAAEALLTGIVGDTGAFQYPEVGESTLLAASKLMELGADKDKIIYNIYRNINFSEIKAWGKIIENMKLDEEYKFVWSAVTLAMRKDYGGGESVKEDAANLFFPIVKGTDFGIIMEEREDGALSVSLRSRSGFDVSQIAKEVGGGGHKAASGARIEGLTFDEAVEKVLAAAKKYANKNRK